MRAPLMVIQSIKTRLRILLFSVIVLLGFGSLAVPPKLTVRPFGANQLQLTAASLQTNAQYLVLARTNSPEGYWVRLTSIFSGTDSTASTLFNLSDVSKLKGVQGLTAQSLARWTFAIGSGEDSNGNEVPDVYEELALRGDPYASADAYADFDGDGWSNLQEMQNGTDPLRFDPPAGPQNLDVRRYTNGLVTVTWSCWQGGVKYWLVERAVRTLQHNTNAGPFILQPSAPLNRTNMNEYLARQRRFQQRYSSAWNDRYNPTYVTGPAQIVARIPARPGQHDYRYTETNLAAGPLSEPVFRVQAHYAVPLRASLTPLDSQSIRRSILSVGASPATNGYDLTVTRSIPHAWYLLLVRDKVNPQWRAGGYFMTGSNQPTLHLVVDKKGMMHAGQSPVALPEVHCLPDVVAPEFLAGWGEDSDGDGLPDVYEVLVTQTDPLNADTGATGVLDGYKEPANDGWSNLEKFRRRADPQRVAVPPPLVELKQPTTAELLQAMTPKTDLACEVELAVRPSGEGAFQPIEQVPGLLSQLLNIRQPHSRKGYDVQVSWRFAARRPGPRQETGFPGEAPPWYAAVAPLMERVNLGIRSAFRNRLEANPPLSWAAASNLTVVIMQAYRGGGMDKGLAMAELRLLADNTAQDFFGRVVDQSGQPVMDATVTATVIRDGSRDNPTRIQTGAQGLFQFVGLRGRSLSLSVEKTGFEMAARSAGLRNANGPETSPTNRAVFTLRRTVSR